jgi:hypothetical protein
MNFLTFTRKRSIVAFIQEGFRQVNGLDTGNRPQSLSRAPRDATVTADYPFAVKFINRALSTSYVVSNLTGAPLNVTFSDGKVVRGVAPYSTEVFHGNTG